DIASDFYYLKEADWKSRTVSARETDVWDPEAQNDSDWSLGYERIFFANVVLDGIHAAELGPDTDADRRNVEGQASFFRGYSFYTLAQLFCPYYSIGQEDSPYGLPLKRSADINERIVRASLMETYEQIIHDLKRSTQLLPVEQATA